MTDKNIIEAIKQMLQPTITLEVSKPVRRKETRQQTYDRLTKEVNRYEAFRAVKKNLRN